MSEDKQTAANGTAERGAMIQVCGLWKGTDKNGKTFLSGSLGNVRVMIFLNAFKADEKHPDYRMYVSEREHEDKRQPVEGDPLNQSAEAQPAQPTGEAPAQPAKGKEDDIPF